METTIAFRAIAPGNDFAEVPACLVLTTTDALRQRILDAATAIRQFGFKQVALIQAFGTPRVCSEDLEGELADSDYVRVARHEFDETEDQRVDSMELMVDFDGDMWLRCYDHYGDHLIESPRTRVTNVLQLAPLEESA
jgi:hypothetical protein